MTSGDGAVTKTSEDLAPEVEPVATAGASIFDQDGVVSAILAGDAGRSHLETEPTATPAPVADEPSGAAGKSLLGEIAVGLKALAADQAELRELFESKIRSDETQAKALERLHDQLRDYKANFVRQEMLPLLRDLIYCYDVADDESGRVRRDGVPAMVEQAAQAFDHLRQMVADVLAKYDVEPFRAGGPEFDRREQQCVRTVPTGEASDDKKIAAAGAIGFRLGDQIIRKEQVTVYKYAPGNAVAHGAAAGPA
jgi:molecular chaperone GrpE (heat shock protein)